MRVHRPAAVIFCAAVLTACGDDETLEGSGGAGAGGEAAGCMPGELQIEDGRCIAAGTQPSGCAAGELALAEGGCLPAGIPPELCGEGFVPHDDGCEPVLPSEPCAAGLMAVPGDTRCREVAPCGSAPWGDIPIDGTTQFVDGSYAGGDSDGTAAKPWTRIQDAIDAVASGGLVAVAQGSYLENLVIGGKSVRLWGRCPSLVEVEGSAARTIGIAAGADGSELHRLAVRGASIGVELSGALDVLFEELWIHETGGRGLRVTPEIGVSSATLRASLIELAHVLGVSVGGSELFIERSVVRDTQPDALDLSRGNGIVFTHKDFPEPASGAIVGSLIERNHEVGVAIQASQVDVETTVIRDTESNAANQSFGRGLVINFDATLDLPSMTVVRSTVIDRNHEVGLDVRSSQATLEGVVVRDTQPQPSDQAAGHGIEIGSDPSSQQRAAVDVRSALISGNHGYGIGAFRADAIVEAAIVRDTQSDLLTQEGGHGIYAIEGSNVEVRGSVLERNHDVSVIVASSTIGIEGCRIADGLPQPLDDIGGLGVAFALDPALDTPSQGRLAFSIVERAQSAGVIVVGSEASIEAVLIRDTLPQPSDELYGGGIYIGQASGLRSMASVRGSIVERAVHAGIMIGSADVSVEATLIRDTQAQAADGKFGDGLVGYAGALSTSLSIATSRIENSARAGVTAFGTQVTLRASELVCNAIHLVADSYLGQPASFVDLGSNRCQCSDEEFACKSVSASLELPPPYEI